MKYTQINSFDIIEVEAAPGADAIIVLHGYGADYRDLAALSVEIPVERPMHWYFVNAPFTNEELKIFGGRMWFSIDMVALQRSISDQHFAEHFGKFIPPELAEVTERLESLMYTIKERHKKLFMAGFSQGSMVAGHMSMRLPSLVSGLILLSSTFVAESIWHEQIKNRPQFPVFQSHGNADPVLPVSEGRRLRDYLKDHGLDISYHEFSGGHQIPYEMMEEAGKFLSLHQSKA